MPIVDEYGSRHLHFGSGDSSVGSGVLEMEKAVGVITFQVPWEIYSVRIDSLYVIT